MAMQRLLYRSWALCALVVPSPSGLQVQPEASSQPSQSGSLLQRRAFPGAHLWSLAQEGFDLHRPGDYQLLRVPANRDEPALFNLHGHIVPVPGAPCTLQLKNISMRGDWLGSSVLQVGVAQNITPVLAIKVSSLSTPYAGPWRSYPNFTAYHHRGAEALPETIKVSMVGQEGNPSIIEFHMGPKAVPNRPVIAVAQNFKGLDLSLEYLERFDVKDFSGVLGTERHTKSMEQISHDCTAAQRHGPRTTSGSMLGQQPRGSYLTASWTLHETE